MITMDVAEMRDDGDVRQVKQAKMTVDKRGGGDVGQRVQWQ